MGAPTKATYAEAEQNAKRAKANLDRLLRELNEAKAEGGENSPIAKRLGAAYMTEQKYLIATQGWLLTWKGKAV
jgi:hypothetical protein